MKIKFLENEPKPKTWYGQLFFFFTRPVASFIDGFNEEKMYKINKRREKIAHMQQIDFIMAVADILYDEVLTYGTPANIDLCKMLCLKEAGEIFYENKYNGKFDDLNIIIKEG